MRHEGRHIDEIAGTGFGGEFEVLAPAHAGLAAHDEDHAFEFAMVMRAGLGVGVDGDGAGPELLRTDAGGVDRGLAIHAGVCAVLPSSELPGMTRTPSCFHFGSWE